MRVEVLLCFGLFLTSTFAMTMKKLNSAQTKQIESLRNAKSSWSRIVINLAELQMMSSGPLDVLEEAIDDLIQDITSKSILNQNDFYTATNLHNSAVSQLNSAIASANSDIYSTYSLLDDVLTPKKGDLIQAIASEELDLSDSHDYVSRISTERKESHDAWTVRVEDHNSAVDAITEAETILSQMVIGGEVSLVQVKSSRAALLKVEKRLGKRINSTIAKALVELASNQFANQDSVHKVLNLLDQIKLNMVVSLENENQSEVRDEFEFESNISLTNDHISQVESTLDNNKIDLANTLNSIQENEYFLAQRQDDLQKSSQFLADENANFVNVNNSFNDIQAELNAEISSAEQVLKILTSGNFASYINDRLKNVEGSNTVHFQA